MNFSEGISGYMSNILSELTYNNSVNSHRIIKEKMKKNIRQLNMKHVILLTIRNVTQKKSINANHFTFTTFIQIFELLFQ